MLSSYYASRLTPFSILMACGALAVGCSNSATPAANDLNVELDMAAPDLAVPPDLSTIDQTIPPDLIMPDFSPPADFELPIDLTMRDFTVVRPDLTVVDLRHPPDLEAPPDIAGQDAPPMVISTRYVVNGMTLPGNKSDFATDLNGDGVRDNAFGGLVSVMAGFNLTVQANVDSSINQGNMLELVQLDTIDPLRENDETAGARVRAAVAKPNPDFSGAGAFSVDNKIAVAAYPTGALRNKRFVATPPFAGMSSIDVKINLYLFGTDPLTLILHGSHVEFNTGVDANSGAPGLSFGFLQGAITQADLTNVLIPALGKALTDEIAAKGPSAMQIQMQIDVGGCFTKGMPAMPGDDKIDDCEVTQFAPFGDALKVDVSLFGQGRYSPDKNNANPDSYSMALGFNAVEATW